MRWLVMTGVALCACTPAGRDAREVGRDRTLAMTVIDAPRAAPLRRAQVNLGRARYQRDGYVLIGQSWLTYARVAGDEGFVTHAAAAARLALDHAPHYGPALAVLAATQLTAHAFATARTTAEEALAKNPTDALALSVAADASLELRELDAAAGYVQRMVAEGRNLASLSRAAHLAWLRGDVAEARTTYDEALALASPNEPEAIAWTLRERAALEAP